MILFSCWRVLVTGSLANLAFALSVEEEVMIMKNSVK